MNATASHDATIHDAAYDKGAAWALSAVYTLMPSDLHRWKRQVANGVPPLDALKSVLQS